jgi:hypothetical protein
VLPSFPLSEPAVSNLIADQQLLCCQFWTSYFRLFLLNVLQQLGFGRCWCNLLCLLLSTASTHVMFIGELGDLIHHQRGP